MHLRRIDGLSPHILSSGPRDALATTTTRRSRRSWRMHALAQWNCLSISNPRWWCAFLMKIYEISLSNSRVELSTHNGRYRVLAFACHHPPPSPADVSRADERHISRDSPPLIRCFLPELMIRLTVAVVGSLKCILCSHSLPSCPACQSVIWGINLGWSEVQVVGSIKSRKGKRAEEEEEDWKGTSGEFTRIGNNMDL